MDLVVVVAVVVKHWEMQVEVYYHRKNVEWVWPVVGVIDQFRCNFVAVVAADFHYQMNSNLMAVRDKMQSEFVVVAAVAVVEVPEWHGH